MFEANCYIISYDTDPHPNQWYRHLDMVSRQDFKK